MELTNDQIAAGGNLQWMMFSGAVAFLYVWRCTRKLRSVDWSWRAAVQSEAFILMAGIACVSGSSFVHRTWWAIWRYYRAIGETEIAQWFVAVSGVVTTPCIAVICLGYAFHLYPVSKSIFGRLWPIPEIAVFVLAFAFGAYAPLLFPASLL